MKIKIKLLLILFNLIVLSSFGQVKLVTTTDTVNVESIFVSKISNKMKKAIDNHLKHLKGESYCISNKNNIMIVDVSEFDTILSNYINLIDYTENEDIKYVISIYTVRKTGQIIYNLNNPSEKHFYLKYKGWDIFLYTKSDIRFQNKGKVNKSIFPLKYRKYTLDKDGTLPYEYLNSDIDIKGYEDIKTNYKLDKSDIER